MKLPGTDRIDEVLNKFQKLTFQKQGLCSIVLAKRLLRLSKEAFINRSALSIEKIDKLVQVFYDQLFNDVKNIEILSNSYEESKLIYTFQKGELMNSQAIDAISIIETSLLILVEFESNFSECLNSYIESIDLLVQDSITETSISTEDRELLIYEHKTMQAELKFMEAFIDFLEKEKDVNRFVVSKVEDIFVFDLA